MRSFSPSDKAPRHRRRRRLIDVIVKKWREESQRLWTEPLRTGSAEIPRPAFWAIIDTFRRPTTGTSQPDNRAILRAIMSLPGARGRRIAPRIATDKNPLLTANAPPRRPGRPATRGRPARRRFREEVRAMKARVRAKLALPSIRDETAREAFRLCRVEGLDQADAAKKLGVSQQTISRWLKKAE